MTNNLKTFIAENEKYPVISGAVIGNGGQGAVYTLSNRRTFKLSVDECGALPEGYPKWADWREKIQ